MKLSPYRIAIVAALAAIAIVACVLRPSSLTVHRSAPAIVSTPEAPAKPLPLRMQVRPLVYVAGAVAHPGVYAVDADARARDAVARAGGATRDADLIAVNLAAHVADGDEIAVPRLGDPRPSTRSPRVPAVHSGRRRRRSPRRAARVNEASGSTAPAAAKLDLNSASEDALAELPGIGPTLAERIVEFRALNGPFATVDGLADVAGITPSHLDEIEPYVTAGH